MESKAEINQDENFVAGNDPVNFLVEAANIQWPW